MDIKKALKYYGHSISSMAGLMGITQSALSQQINNNSMTFAKMEMIAGLCGTNIIDFVKAGNDVKDDVFCAFVYNHGQIATFDNLNELAKFVNQSHMHQNV
jgi:transcriptional regulator with XRE-family HTH domain